MKGINAINLHVGSRIRLYRKAKGLSLEQLSKLIFKSKSTISKYETGEISVDIVTLFEISSVLGVSINQLTDYKIPHAIRMHATPKGSFFSDNNMLFMYYYDGDTKKITKSILEVNAPSESILYHSFKDIKVFQNCAHLYSGTMTYSDTYVNFVLQNQANDVEKLFLTIANPFTNKDITYGIITGISDRYLKPISYKFTLSKAPLQEDEHLIESLKITKFDINQMKKTNAFLMNSFTF